MTRRHLRFAAGALTFVWLTTCVTVSTGASPRKSPPTDRELAQTVNLTLRDLPTEILWNRAGANPATASEFAQGQKAVSCIRSAGGLDAKVGPDPFGTYGKSGGIVTADVTSSTFSPHGSTSGLPQAGTETVIVKTKKQATTDLAIFATKRALNCYGNALVSLASASHDKAGIKSFFLSRAPYGDGNRGVHVHYELVGGLLNEPFYDDSYFYVEGRGEIIFNFANEGIPFTGNFASSIIAQVMSRAKSLLG